MDRILYCEALNQFSVVGARECVNMCHALVKRALARHDVCEGRQLSEYIIKDYCEAVWQFGVVDHVDWTDLYGWLCRGNTIDG